MKRFSLMVVLVALALAWPACKKKGVESGSPTSTPTRIIALSGNMGFGDVVVGQTPAATLTIANNGTATLTVIALQITAGLGTIYAANWTGGTIPAGAMQSVTIQFAPLAAIAYNGTITVAGDQTSGTNTIGVSGAGSANSLIPLTGVVTSSGGTRLTGATVTILDGPNTGRSAITASGNYQFTGLIVGNANASAVATGFEQAIKGTFINGANTLNFTLLLPPFTASGTGDDVFTLPSSVSRVRITAHYAGSSSNFIVRIGSSLVVNELVGTYWGQVDFAGTYLTGGGIVQITNSSGVSWTFTEVR